MNLRRCVLTLAVCLAMTGLVCVADNFPFPFESYHAYKRSDTLWDKYAKDLKFNSYYEFKPGEAVDLGNGGKLIFGTVPNPIFTNQPVSLYFYTDNGKPPYTEFYRYKRWCLETQGEVPVKICLDRGQLVYFTQNGQRRAFGTQYPTEQVEEYSLRLQKDGNIAVWGKR